MEWSGVEWSVVQCSVLVLVETATKLHVLLTFDKVHNPLRLLRKTTTKRPKVVRTPSVFYTFDFEMCFALRATMASTFSTSQLAKVLWTRCAFNILTWKCASRHNVVQLFISHLARWLRTRCFSEPTFRPSGATNHWKNAANRGFPTFSRTCPFFLLTLSPLWSSHCFSSPLWLFPPLLFHLSILSEVWLF